MRVLLFLAVLASSGGSLAHAQAVWYVDADATGAETGTSWTDAFTDLQDALAVVQAGDEVWIAEGTYKPTTGTDRTATFALRSGVALYGGFDGTETTRDERDWAEHASVLSGDIGTLGDSLDNAYHVVSADGTDGAMTALDGLIVRHGFADGPVEEERRGGGLVVWSGGLTVRNSAFRYNGAFTGGGAYVESGGAVTVTDCVFEGNVAGDGGALLVALPAGGGAATLERVSFVRNRAFFRGGGMLSFGSEVRLTDVVFEMNTGGTGDDGGGLHVDGGPALLLRVAFTANTSNAGGGLFVEDTDDLACINCLFIQNTASVGAGAYASLAAPTFINTPFLGNRTAANGIGGAFFASGNIGGPESPRPLFVNGAFVGNRAGLGGAVGGFGIAPVIVNTTFAANVAAQWGHAYFARFSGEADLHNAVLWDGGAAGPGEIRLEQGATVDVNRAIVRGSYPGTAVLDADPLFVRDPSPGPDSQWGTQDDDYGDLRLMAGSPGLDFGLASLLPPDVWDLDADGDTLEALPLDLNNGPRVEGSEVDLGPYEGEANVANEPEPPASPLTLAVAPNPARGAAAVTLTLARAARVEVAVYDARGRRVAWLRDGVLAAGPHRFTLDRAGLPPGAYFVRARGEGAAVSRPLTVVR